MQRSIVDSGRYKHVVYSNSALNAFSDTLISENPYGSSNANSARTDALSPDKLHIYIEGDGAAWRNRFVISENPTSRNVLMLDLMAMDTAGAMYIGRPCYLGMHGNPGCDSALWTYQRFSSSVVESMVLLIAARMPKVSAVVTVAGNLDTRAWVKHHRYTPLFGSLNPARQPALSSDIRQLHLLGARDQVIPPKLVQNWIAKQPGASVWRFDSYTHSCCWKKQWRRVLNWVETGVSPGISGAPKLYQ